MWKDAIIGIEAIEICLNSYSLQVKQFNTNGKSNCIESINY